MTSCCAEHGSACVTLPRRIETSGGLYRVPVKRYRASRPSRAAAAACLVDASSSLGALCSIFASGTELQVYSGSLSRGASPADDVFAASRNGGPPSDPSSPV